ncbi:MAG: ABC transporter ATP-binding protein [Pseudomonadota bacterium]|nr:ABC transporter ATP-binding protein [Pseudomonadota bacterium]
MTKTLLKTSDLNLAYGQVFALRDFSCQVKEGKITALVGSNGAGKTTLLRALSGLLRPKKGVVQFLGNDITFLSSHERVEAGLVMVPEGRLIFPNFTVEQNLKIGAISKRALGEIETSLEKSYVIFPKLEQRRYQLGGTLSGGEQQMLALARGLMARPKLLMLDEPTLGLAPLVAESIFEMIVRLKKMGLTILIVEQNVNRTLQVADTAYVLENGSGIMEGVADDILKNPKVRQSYMGL